MESWLTDKLCHLGMWLAVEVGRCALRMLPRSFFYSLSEGAANLGFYLFHGFRKRSIRNLAIAFGEQLDEREIAQITRRSLRNFFHDFVEIVIALHASPDEVRRAIPFHGREHLDAALARGKGAIALSAHLGNFFLVGTRLALEGYSTYTLVNQSENGGFPRLMDRYRLELGQKTISARPRREAAQELVQILRRNELAIVIADEYRSGSGIHVPFFNRTVLARRGPATLTLRTGAALVPIYLVRDQSGRLTLIAEPEIEPSKSGNIKNDVKENTLQITQWLERVVRAYPDQWNWMNVRWQEGPQSASIGKEHGYEGSA